MSSDQLIRATTADDRPSVSAPDALSPAALADARRSQPRRGLVGLLFVVPVAVLLAAGAGGPAHSLAVLGPVTTFALPLVAMIAFWWEDWPGSLARGAWAGVYDTAIVIAGGLVLDVAGQAVSGGHGAVPLAAGIFTIMLQLTLVCERRPLAGLGRIPAGVAALVACWVAGAVAFLALVRSGAVTAEDYGAWLTALGVWQMIWYVALRGWPFARIRRRAMRLVVANVVVLACGWATYLVARGVGCPAGRLTAVAGAGIASVLLVSMLFQAWPAIRFAPLPGRCLALVIVVALTALLAWTLPLVAHATGVPAADVNSWTAHTTLNALSLAVILHVAVWRRWPSQQPAVG
ncbi:MAG TPA: hypothetical protein VHF06_31815 [Pseudonocardiaceae bacterium]|jgi:hypothetical protein|nr:hypothetical protein [Pseudonocardiaceae bacterium]